VFLLAIAASLLSIAFAPVPTASTDAQQKFVQQFVAAAIERTHHVVRYDSAYVRIPLSGRRCAWRHRVCTDERIRSYRAVSVDLQKEVHEDMAKNLAAYPHGWNVAHPDTNIDHRRVPNLRVFFSRNGEVLPISARSADYHPGDLLTWDAGGGVPHIGIVVDRISQQSGRYMIVHNIGKGP
jgi:uncharacterized protein